MFDLFNLCNPFADPDKDIKPVSDDEAHMFPECDYEKNPTNLYKEIQAEHWVAVNHFLLTGYWHGNFFSDKQTQSQQACTWVTRYEPRSDGKKRVVWTHLPIHAAIIYGAPDGVVSLLAKIAPPCIRCADDQRMLPLHLAFRHGSTDAVVTTLMDYFPEAVTVRDFKGRTPAECAEDGPKASRGRIIQTVVEYNQRLSDKQAAKVHEKEIDSIKDALKLQNQKVVHLETALDLIKCREDQTRESFSLVVTELRKMKGWFDEQEAEIDEDDEDLNASFVKETSKKLSVLQQFAEELDSQQRHAKEESDETLHELKAVWKNEKSGKSGKSTKNEAAKTSEKKTTEKKATEELPTTKAPIKEVVKEVVEEPVSILDKEVPGVVSVQNDSDEGSVEISGGISAMTSLDMSEDETGSKVSKKIKSFRKGLKKITSSKKISSRSVTANDLPPKTPLDATKKSSSKVVKMPKLTTASKLKVSPTM